MDLYQAVKTDKCHSSPGRLQVNPDQQGAATCSTQVPACRGAIWTPSATEHDHRSAAEAAFFFGFLPSSTIYDVIVASKRCLDQGSHFSPTKCLSGRSGAHQKATFPLSCLKKLLMLLKP